MINGKITIVNADEWKGLYVDGILLEENHSLNLISVLKHLGINFEIWELPDDFMNELGRLPNTLDKLEDAITEYDCEID